MLVPNTQYQNTRARCTETTGDDESAPKTRDSTRRRCIAATLAVEDTSTDGPVVAVTPGVYLLTYLPCTLYLVYS